MPANESLDFVSHHLYQPPSSFVDMQGRNPFDRLHGRWPEKPITLGNSVIVAEPIAGRLNT